MPKMAVVHCVKLAALTTLITGSGVSLGKLHYRNFIAGKYACMYAKRHIFSIRTEILYADRHILYNYAEKADWNLKCFVIQWNGMKQSRLFPLARLGSSLSLLGILLCMHMTFTLAHFLPSDSRSTMYAVYIFYFAGIAAGVVLCPLFLSVPNGKNKPLFVSVGFIAFLIALEFILRSLGFHVWLASAAVRGIMAVPEGIETAMCYGLFYLTWLRRPAVLPVAGDQANRTGRFCSLILGAALLGSVLARYYSVPLMEKGIAAKTR